VIEDADCWRKNNALDGNSMQIIAQAYYLSGEKTVRAVTSRNGFFQPPATPPWNC